MIFFDIGATLVRGPSAGPSRQLARAFDRDDAWKAAVDQALLTRNIPDQPALCRLLREEFDLAAADGVEEAVATVWASQEEGVTAIDGAHELLQGLQAIGQPFGFISNIWAPYATSFEELYGYIWLPGEGEDAPAPVSSPDLAFYSYEVGHAKPDTAFYQAVLDKTGLKAADCVMIGDTYDNDIAPAMALGMKTVWLVHRPDKELDALRRVQQGESPAPDVQMALIAALTPWQLRGLIHPEPEAPPRPVPGEAEEANA